MKLTALEIKQQQFEKSLRGYDPAEVQSFLNLIASEWEHMTGRVRELENQLDKMNDKLMHYERVEEALHETLQTARSSAEEKLNGARNEAKNITEKAENKAESIIQEAYQQRREMRQNVLQLIDRRDEMIRSLTSYLENTGEALKKFSNDEQSLFSLPDNVSGEEDGSINKRKKGNEENLSVKSDSVLPGTDKIDDILDDID